MSTTPEKKPAKRSSKIKIDPNNRIVIKGAREHNLKNVDLELPRDKLIVMTGLSDVIVDIVETGTTLKENDLTVIEEFMPISARFIANKASYKFKYAQLTELLNKMKEALAK